MESRFIEFVKDGANPKYDTEKWSVSSKSDGGHLGSVIWYAPWKRYTFESYAGVVFDHECLRDIATFMAGETAKKKARAG